MGRTATAISQMIIAYRIVKILAQTVGLVDL